MIPKKGQKVACVNNYHWDTLTVGREYRILDVEFDDVGSPNNIVGVFVVCDDDRQRLVEVKCFIPADSQTSAKKQSDGKPPLDLIIRLPGLLDVANVFGYGANKYPDIDGDFNWRKGVNDFKYKSKLIAAGLRHVAAYMCGDKNDKETGIPHLAHAVSNFLMVADIDIKEKA
jgi:hypothetical protein